MATRGESRDADELRFDRAEFAGTEVAPPQGSAAESLPASQALPTCCACQHPITGIYYTSAADLICSSCREQYVAYQAAGSRFGRFSRAVVHGLAAGMAGALIWFAVRRLTGYEIGLIAIVLGYMVGAAVRAGSRARGGLGYQLLAVFLTYTCIALNYVPDVYEELREEFGETQPTEETTRSAIPAASTTPPAPTTEEVAAVPAATDTGPDDSPDLPEPVRLLLMAAVVFSVAFVGTALVSFEQPILLLILGFALWQAWKLNRRMPVHFAGPFALGQLSSGPSAPADPVGAP